MKDSTELSKLTPAQESNKLRDEILDLLERHTNPALAVYPLLHFFEGKIREMKAEHRKKVELAFDAGRDYAYDQNFGLIPSNCPNKDQWIKDNL